MHRSALVPIVVLAAFWPLRAAAQDPAPVPPRDPAGGCLTLSPGCRTVELSAQYFVEAWNFNGRQVDTMQGAMAAMTTTIRDGWGIAFELLGTRVAQGGPDAFIGGLSGVFRRRLAVRRSTVFFLEGGAGASYSDQIVPERGTRYNYLLQGGVGMAAHVSPHLGAILSARVFHLSNANLNGSHHNPDIEALGGRLGLFVVF